MLDGARSCREIAAELGRAPSTVANEVARHRFVTAPKSLAQEWHYGSAWDSKAGRADPPGLP